MCSEMQYGCIAQLTRCREIVKKTVFCTINEGKHENHLLIVHDYDVYITFVLSSFVL